MDYISKPTLMGKMTSSEEQKKIKAMTGEEAYNEFLMLVNGAEKADVVIVHRRGCWKNRIDTETEMHECNECGARVVKGLYEYENPNRFCYHCGARMGGTQPQREDV